MNINAKSKSFTLDMRKSKGIQMNSQTRHNFEFKLELVTYQ